MPNTFPSGNLLTTKLEVPLVGSRIVLRRRLTDALKAGVHKQLTMLIAPAGYGKTTLIVEWLSDLMLPDWRIVWLTVDSFDNKPYRLWSYVASAMKKVYPRMRFDPQRLFQDRLEQSPFEFLTPLLNAIAQAPYQLVLILDDYQHITNDHVHEEIHYLLDHQPKNLHLLISSRTSPPIPVSRLRAQRQLVEMTARDLSFNLKEAKEFFSSAMEMDIDHDQAISMLVATEGWIAGLQLVTLSLQDQPDQKSFIANLPLKSYQIFEYLTEEVLDHQTPELRDFLLKTSILSELSAPLCDAMLERDDSQEMLNQIQQANLFISLLDEQRFWYSYHRLFADTLYTYLLSTHPATIPELHRKACAWLQENGYPDKAVTHALAIGDVRHAARIIDTCALQAVINFDLVQLVAWLGRFSEEVMSKRPQLGIYYALASLLLVRIDSVEPKLQTLEQFLGKLTDEGIPIEDEMLIRWEIASIRAWVDCWREPTEGNLSRITELMQNAPRSDEYFRGLLSHLLGEVYAFQGNLDAAIDAYSKGCQFAIDHGLLREYCYSQSELAYVRKMQGRLEDTVRDYQVLIEYAIRMGITDDVIGFAKTGLAEIALERNQLDEADKLIQWVIENFEKIESSPRNWIRQEWLFSRLANYYLARQDIPNAMTYYNKAMDGLHANRQVVHYLASQLIDLQVEVWLATGELHSRELSINEQIDYHDPTGKSYQAKQTALARYYLALDEPEKALGVLNELAPELEKHNMNERLMKALVLKSLACQASGSFQQSLDALHKALQIALPEGYRRVFTNKGEPMKILLKEYARQLRDDENGSMGKMISELIIELDQKKLPPPSLSFTGTRSPIDLSKPMLEPLTHRELEVVKLIANGKTTKEIAIALAISVATTKSHIKNIYKKIEVHTRSELRKRVIELGIL
ncbi:MAG: hypothetical protein JXA42_12330 [Anaerolineales bacterium]|nr:hypothetical protein [Anaerolineales bacterium]